MKENKFVGICAELKLLDIKFAWFFILIANNFGAYIQNFHIWELKKNESIS